VLAFVVKTLPANFD